MFIAALVRFLWPYLLEEKIIIFQFFKKMQRGQKVNILDKNPKIMKSENFRRKLV
jgi:hypothetical protein